jgi:hypothetical protein
MTDRRHDPIRFATDNEPALFLSDLTAELTGRGLPRLEGEQRDPATAGWRYEQLAAPEPASWSPPWADAPATSLLTLHHAELLGLVAIVEAHSDGAISSTQLIDPTTAFGSVITGWHGWTGLIEFAAVTRQLLDRYNDNLVAGEVA